MNRHPSYDPAEARGRLLRDQLLAEGRDFLENGEWPPYREAPEVMEVTDLPAIMIVSSPRPSRHLRVVRPGRAVAALACLGPALSTVVHQLTQAAEVVPLAA